MAKTLAVTYRPLDWDSVVGQESTKIILQQQLATNSTRNSYLFVGASGCGKTTCARIFAKEINHGQGVPIEMDAASHSSVEDVREIIKMAQTKSLDSEYKVLIIDECFPKHTRISTPDGDKNISDVVPGDMIYSMSGINKVTHLFKNRVLTDRLCCVTVNDRKIITTVEHLFFTNVGWVMAKDLQKGDIIYGDKDLQELWKRVHKETGQRYSVLLKQLCDKVQICSDDGRAEMESSEGNINMSSMWDRICCSSESDTKAQNLLEEMRNNIRFESIFTVGEYRVWDGAQETIIRKNEAKQSDGQSSNSAEDVGYEREEWNTSCRMGRQEGWKREVHNSADSLIRSIRRWLGSGVCNQHEVDYKLEGATTTLVLQSRPWLSKNETCDRGRWQNTLRENSVIEGCEENKLSGTIRVESVEVYKRGSNDELFRGSFTDTELSGEYVIMYDLEVENDHSYFADGVLVHNCHSISNTGWQAFLKTIEEPPAKSIFIFCTTNPEKIPKTILNRVQRYDFRRIGQKDIEERLEYVLKEESIKKYDADAISFITRQSRGGMRDALSLLDKCLGYSEEITLDNVLKALELSDTDTFLDLTDCVLYKDTKTIIEIIEGVYASGEDMKQFIKQYMNFVLDVSKYLVCGDFKYTQLPETGEMKDWLRGFKSDDLDNILDLLDKIIAIDADIKFSSSAKEYIEVQLITF